MLENAQERNFLRRFDHLFQYGVKHVQMRIEVDPVGTRIDLRFVAFTLLVEHVELNHQVAFGRRFRMTEVGEDVQQAEADEFIANAITILKSEISNACNFN